jgi:preprotein translocase subunit YajC
MTAIASDVAIIVFYLIMLILLCKIWSLVRKQQAKTRQLEQQLKLLEKANDKEEDGENG